MPCDDCSRAETCPPCVNGLDGTRTADMHAILVGLLSVSHTPVQADHAAGEVLRQHAHKLAEQQRRQAAQIAILRSEDARLTAKGLRMGADLIDPHSSIEELRP